MNTRHLLGYENHRETYANHASRNEPWHLIYKSFRGIQQTWIQGKNDLVWKNF